MAKEARIFINNHQIPNSDSMTIRVALNAFVSDLEENGLGDDQHGKSMTKNYIDSAKRLLNKIDSDI